MTPYEQMIKFEVGMEMGLLTIDDLRDFLTESLHGSDVPYIYTDVYLSLPKGYEAVVETIFYNLHNNYTIDRTQGNNVQRMLIGVIKNKLHCGAIDMDQCIKYLHDLTNYSECGWDLLAIDEYYHLVKSGYYSQQEFNLMLNNIFAQAL